MIETLITCLFNPHQIDLTSAVDYHPVSITQVDYNGQQRLDPKDIVGEPLLSQTGNLSSNHASNSFTFLGRKGQSLIFSVESQDFDPYIIIQDSQGKTIATNKEQTNNKSHSPNHSLVNVTATFPSNANYRLVIKSNSGEYGKYQITVRQKGLF